MTRLSASSPGVRALQPSTATTLSVYEWRALFENVTVAECMARDPVTIAPDASVLEAAQCMLDYKIGGLPVVVGTVAALTEHDWQRNQNIC